MTAEGSNDEVAATTRACHAGAGGHSGTTADANRRGHWLLDRRVKPGDDKW